MPVSQCHTATEPLALSEPERPALVTVLLPAATRVLRLRCDAECPHANEVYRSVSAALYNLCVLGERLLWRACRRHWSESDNPSNTARLAALAMPNLTLLDYGGRGTMWNPITLDDNLCVRPP